MSLDTNVFGADTWRATAFVLDSTGAPLATTVASDSLEIVYEGVDIPGIQDWTPNFPKIRTIAGVAQGRVKDTLAMPPNTVMQGTLKSLYHSQALEAALTNVKLTTILTKSLLPRRTDRQGLEPTIMLMVQQLVTHGDDGLPVWYTLIFPHTRVIPLDSTFNANASSMSYDMVVSPSKVKSFGLPYTIADDGCLNSSYEDWISTGLFNLVFYKADGASTDFPLPTDKQAASTFATTMGMFDFSNQGATIAGTPAADKFSAGAAPTVNHILALIYEIA